jgi:IS30 family transposase
MIDCRPEVITLKQRFGDWELRSNRRSQTDTVVGPENRGAILTATERTTGFLLMRKLKEGEKREGTRQGTVLYVFALQRVCSFYHFRQRQRIL